MEGFSETSKKIMTIGLLSAQLHIYGSASLKEKRQVLKSLKDKIRHRFNVSIAEIDNHDKWQLATIGIACLGQEKPEVNSALDKVLNFIRSYKELEIGNYEIQLL